jgi:hypothetical protein
MSEQSWWEAVKEAASTIAFGLPRALNRAIDARPSGGQMRKHLKRVKAIDNQDGSVSLLVGHDVEGNDGREKEIDITFRSEGRAELVDEALQYAGSLKRHHIREAKQARNRIVEGVRDREREKRKSERGAKKNGESRPARAPAVPDPIGTGVPAKA